MAVTAAGQAAAAISPGQGPYMYSYAMNVGVGVNVKPPATWRTKITQWRSPARKILLTELLEKINTAPASSHGDAFASPRLRHLTRKSYHGDPWEWQPHGYERQRRFLSMAMPRG